MKKLDLSVYAENTWEVTMPTGEVLQIKKPTQKQLIMLNGYDVKLTSAETVEDKFKILNEVAAFIVNNNKSDKKYKTSHFDEMQIDILYAIYFGYQEFVTEVMANPN